MQPLRDLEGGEVSDFKHCDFLQMQGVGWEKDLLSIFGKCRRASDVILEIFMCPCNHQKCVLAVFFP